MISVAMVTYNGEKYLQEQLDSILRNLAPDDELVVSDDGSADRTKEILQSYRSRDARIRILDGPGRGVVANVAHALKYCRGDYIFLSDQDDVWMPDKMERVMWAFRERSAVLVVHDAKVVDSTGAKVLLLSFFAYRKSRAGAWKNLVKNSYMGCCMAFRREALGVFCPIPEKVPMHDQWIGICCDLARQRVVFLPETLIRYRRHADNASGLTHSGAANMIKNRLVLIRELMRYRRRGYAGKQY